MLPQLKGLAILDNDGRDRASDLQGPLKIIYWKRYEAENYFVTPDVFVFLCLGHYADLDLFGGFQAEIDSVLDELLLEQLFDGVHSDFQAWKQASPEIARVLWEAKTERRKLSAFAEEFFRKLAEKLGGQMLLKKGELHRLVPTTQPQNIVPEVREKLDLLYELLAGASSGE